MRYVEEANAEEGQDLEAGGLMDDVDELLGEDETDVEEHHHQSRTAPVLKDSRKSIDDMQASRRASTTSDWGDNLSDFADSEPRQSDDAEDGWGLSMDTIEERPTLNGRSMSQLGASAVDKRRD